MRVKLQYILVLLLFVLTGMLCREPQQQVAACSPSSPSIRAGGADSSVFGDNAHSEAFTLLAVAQFSEGVLSQSIDQKALAQAISLFGFNASQYPAGDEDSFFPRSEPPPGGVKYYIYTLEKILI